MKPRLTPIVFVEGVQYMIWKLAVGTKAVKLFVLTVFFVGGMSLSSTSSAQDAPAEGSPKAERAAKSGEKKKTNIDFEDELVEGELKKPELFYLLQKKQFNFKRLIKLRENFLPEMRRDGDEIRRGRSKN